MRRFAASVLFSATITFAGGAYAQEEGQESAGDSRATSFEAASEAQAEDVPGGTLLIAAYAIALLLLLGYLISLGVRQARTAADLERLRLDLARHDDPPKTSAGKTEDPGA